MTIDQPIKRLRRPERREQILDAATRAFARHGFTDTSLDDISAEAEVTRVLLYRHFDSKADLYRAVLDRTCSRLIERVGADDYEDDALPALVRAAADNPDGFRLLFHFAAREREFHEMTTALAEGAIDIARRNLAKELSSGPWLEWAARLIPAATTEAVIAWLDAGMPDPATAPDRLRTMIEGIVHAAQGKT